MKHVQRLSGLALAAFVAGACADSPTAPAVEDSLTEGPDFAKVTVSDAAGLQAALTEASTSRRVRKVELKGDVVLDAPLTYDSRLPLFVDGNGYTISGPDIDIDDPIAPADRVGEPSGGDAFVILGGGNVHFEDLTIAGAAGNGIYMEVPAGARGTVRVSFDDVALVDNGLSGFWLEEQASTAQGPIGSRAGLFVIFDEAIVTGNGFAGADEQNTNFSDFDGTRINEGGRGSIRLRVEDSHFDGNAGDGLELDEKGEGGTWARIEDSSFDENGSQPQEAGSDDPDLEDGFDIDEAGDGGILVVMEGVTANNSADEGIDLDEEGEGNVMLRLEDVEATGSTDENIKVSEDADREDTDDPLAESGGNLVIRFEDVIANASGDDGVQLEDFGPGRILGTIEDSEFADNGDNALDFEQTDPNTGRVRLDDVTFTDNGDDDVNADGVNVIGS